MLKEFYETGEFPYKGRTNMDRMAYVTINNGILLLKYLGSFYRYPLI